jgi:outer membrane protein assembly factor BamB
MIRYTKWFVAVTLVIACCDAVVAENWPRFRGPTGQGISTESDLPLRWSASENVAWKTPIPGEGWSSPAVWGDRVFLTSATAEGTTCHVMCVDRLSGKVLWDREVFQQRPARKEGKNSYASPTPVTDGERVYAVFGDGSAVALSLDGEVAWTNRDVKFYSRHGLGASPILFDGLVIMPYDGSNRVDSIGRYPNNSAEERLGWQIPWDKSFIAALDAQTGRRIWTAQRGLSRIAHVTPILVPIDGRQQLISPAGDVVQGFDPRTGKLLWTAASQGEGVVPSPAAGDGLIFTSSGFEKTTLRAVRTGGSGDVTETHIAWEEIKGCPTQPSLLYVKPYLYAVSDNGVVTCYEAPSGKLVYQNRIGGNHSASPVYADGHLYFLSEDGETTVIQAGPNFETVARNPLNERCQASMAISQGNLFIRTDKHLYCIGE